ncbi:hypothetical protein OS175_08615 [Marinicella sp. S1101]|uniref:hypothetical protein n=1 Tax=Marinicella marina TaxID=2996016 RepID=UPI002260BE22|nr:hypothetical protein [Marinicella marina]MCX7553940.1 hypothetical protein [Marinicella marina]
MSYKSILKFTTLLLACLQVHAGSPIDFTPHGTQPGLSFSLSPPTDCSSCHKGGSVADDQINMPHWGWMGSMKANATRDPLFWAALDVANNDIPGVGDFCLKCHTPQGWFSGRVVKPAFEGQPLLDGANGCELGGTHVSQDSKNSDYSGVTCHFCHRIDEQGPNGEAQIIENANVWLDDENCENGFGPCRKGPYKYEDFNTPPHVWEYSDFIQSAEFCGSCHNVSSPTIEQDGVLTVAKRFWHEGVQTELAMPIERTYSEWQNSYFSDLIFKDPFNDLNTTVLPAISEGENCQTCHMPQSTSDEARACIFDPLDENGDGRRKGNLATHQFAGGNTWIPQVIKGVYGDELQANDTSPGRKAALDLTTSYAFDMLQNKSALIEASVTDQSTEQLDLAVKVTNLTGHKLPTGYPEGRRIWINVVVRDNAQQVIWESGAYDEATGILTQDTQAKVYEAIPGIWNADPDNNPMTDDGVCEITDDNNNKMFHFVLNDCIGKDNRIPPLGFRGAENIEMKPVGITYPADPSHPGAVVNYDITNYQVPINGQTGPFTVTATLKFQTASKDYIEFLDRQSTENNFQTENQMCDRTWTVGPADQTRGAFMKELWENYNRSAPVDMTMDFVENVNP